MSDAAHSSPAVTLTSTPVRVRDVLRLAWPAALSYLLNNAYRINDQFWIQGLGEEAQAAISGTLFVVIMNFSLVFLAAGGTLALVARATGAGDRQRRDAVISSALVLGVGLWIVLATLGPALAPHIVGFLALEGRAAPLAEQYISTLYLGSLPLVLAPAIDHALIGMGNTVLPSLMELCAVVLNYFLAPIAIYGAEAAERIDHPGVKLAASVARALGIEGHGIAGAAWCTVISRACSVSFGLILMRRFYGVRYLAGLRKARELAGRALFVLHIARISAPISLSIATYASVYWALIKWVVVPLGNEALAALGIGFAVFEGVTFPTFLGVAMAGASLVGRSLGAGDPARALSAVRSTRKVSLTLGLTASALFWTFGAALAPSFSQDLDVVREVTGYVFTLAFSQVFVALESAHEKVLLGAGYTRPALWVSLTGNGLRIPLAWLLGLRLGLGAHGVWWAINITSVLKCSLQVALVQRGRWLDHRPRT